MLRRGVTISGELIGASCRHLVVYFDFNSYDITGAGLGVLSGQSACLRGARGNLRVEGNCDERGTTEYNLSLGDRRAQAVQRWLVGQGISPARISTVSYGEERPAARGHDEAAWSQNRRVEIFLQD
ncbi:MAG: OmpA family protein [Pseudomonadota bacterium]